MKCVMKPQGSDYLFPICSSEGVGWAIGPAQILVTMIFTLAVEGKFGFVAWPWIGWRAMQSCISGWRLQ
jgi:hypothetical protein